MRPRVSFLTGLAGLCGAAGAMATGCGDGGGFPDAGSTPVIAAGNVSLAWSLTDLGGQPITCDQVGATTVALTLSSLDKVYGVADSFSCGNSPSVSMSADVGNYQVSAELHGSSLTAVAAPDQHSVVITADHTTQLTPVTFAVDATGSLAIQLAAPPATSNCKPTAMMGAGITGDTITLEHSGGVCAPVTFVRSRGGVTVGSYTVSCTAPVTTPCIETDETLTATSIPSGPYTIHIRGQVGATACWQNDDSFAVPAQGKALARTLNLANQLGTPGC